MGAFLAIVGDTWRQSKQQIVFFILAGVLLLTGIGFVAGFKVKSNEEGKPVMSFPFGDEKAQFGLDFLWDAKYRELVHQELKHDVVLKAKQEEVEKLRSSLKPQQMVDLDNEEPSAEQLAVAKAIEDYTQLRKDQVEAAQKVVDERSKNLSSVDKGVEIWLHWATWLLFKFSMWLFIAGCAGYFPGMLAAGAVDVLVSKPISRAQLFFGKFLGGMVLFSALLFVVYLLVFLGVGIRTGTWHLRFFAGIPLTIFSASLLYAMVAWIGVFTRSTAFAIIIGYLFYFIIDTFVGWTQRIGEVSEIAESFTTVKTVSDFAKIAFPGFGRLEDAASAAVLNVPILEFQPFMVASLWLIACLGTAYYKFYKLDF